jgi:uncharacterized membrane protein YeiH
MMTAPGTLDVTSMTELPAALMPTTLLLTLDLMGTFVFAISGAAAGVKSRLDVFGVSVLAFVAGNAGGMTRDVLLGSVPPAAISDWRYVAVSLVAGVTTFLWYPNVKRVQHVVMLFDAAGLGIFAVSGAQKALAYGVNPLAAVLLGMLTGIGGGMARDLLVKRVPVVLRTDVYAIAALAGAAIVVAGHLLHWPPTATTISGAMLCVVMRLIALRRGWNLPIADHLGRPVVKRK